MHGRAVAWAEHALVVPEDHVEPAVSAFTVFGAGALLWLLFLVLLLMRIARQRRNARQAEASYQPQVVLVPGETVLHGTVALAAGASVAVKVEVRQHGTEKESSGRWSYRWEEKGREVHVAPFYLRRSSGERIRVEPPADVLLVDDMDGKILVDQCTRIRFAELVPAEAIYARGELVRAPDPEAEAGYRDGRQGWVLRRPRGSRMLLSSRPLGERFGQRVAFHRRWAIGLALLVAGFQAAAAPYHARLFAGRTVDGVVADLRHRVTTDSEGDDVHHYDVTARLPDGRAIVDEVDRADFAALRTGDHVPIRVVPALPGHERLGAGASIHVSMLVIPLIAFPVLLLVYRHRRKRTRPWFENLVIDTGSGRLSHD